MIYSKRPQSTSTNNRTDRKLGYIASNHNRPVRPVRITGLMNNRPTCSRVVREGVVDQPHVHMLEGTVVSDMVLLKSLGVKDRNLQAPHHRDGPQYDLIILKVPPQEIVQVISVAEGTSMECIRISNTIGSS